MWNAMRRKNKEREFITFCTSQLEASCRLTVHISLCQVWVYLLQQLSTNTIFPSVSYTYNIALLSFFGFHTWKRMSSLLRCWMTMKRRRFCLQYRVGKLLKSKSIACMLCMYVGVWEYAFQCFPTTVYGGSASS